MREVVAWALSCVITLMFMVVGGNIYLKIRKALSKRPHKSDDEEDNPIVKFKDDLAEIYEDNPNGKLKKLAQAVWNRVEEIEKWHDTEIKDIERRYYSAQCDAEELKDRCNKYNKELGEWYARYDNLKKKLAESEKCLNHSLEREANLRKANEGLHKLLKEEQEKNKIPIFSDQTEVPAYLISENTFGGQTNSFAKIILNTKPGEPIPVGYSGTAKTATEATELAERLQRIASQPIVLDSETLNEPPIKNEEFIKQLRDWWGLEASKAVELPKDEPPIYSEEFNKKLREIWFGVDNDTECQQYSVTVSKNGKEEKIIVLARSPIEAAKLVPKGYTVENISKLFE